MKEKLAISIVSHGHEQLLKSNLPALVTTVAKMGGQIVVVDNHPGHTCQTIEADFPSVKFLASENLGYGAGHNLALSHCKTQYHLVCNPDIRVEPNQLLQMTGWLDKHPEVAALCPRVLNEDGSLQYLNRRLPTLYDSALRYLVALIPLFKPVFARRLHWYETRDLGYDRERDLDTMTGCFMLMRRQVLDEMNGFDTSFFLYFEDTDLSYRISRNHTIRFVPQFFVYHQWGRSQYRRIRLFLAYLKSMIRFFGKWGWRFF